MPINPTLPATDSENILAYIGSRKSIGGTWPLVSVYLSRRSRRFVGRDLRNVNKLYQKLNIMVEHKIYFLVKNFSIMANNMVDENTMKVTINNTVLIYIVLDHD